MVVEDLTICAHMFRYASSACAQQPDRRRVVLYCGHSSPPPLPPPQPEPACTLPAEPMFLVQTGMFCIEIIVDISYKRFIFHSEALAFASPGD